MLQVLIAFLLAGFGNVGAGVILDQVQQWTVFTSVGELFILVPALLGLKGNLEMTMASRLSTQANLGHMDNIDELFSMTKGNLALVQCQATVVSFAVAVFACVVKWKFGVDLSSGLSKATTTTSSSNYEGVYQAISTGNQTNHSGTPLPNTATTLYPIGADNMLAMSEDDNFDWDNAFVLCASSLLTANVACFLLGIIMVIVIVGSHRLKIDPDNIASPVAASLGDMTTAGLLAVVAHTIYNQTQTEMPYLSLVIVVFFIAMLPVWTTLASTNPYTADVVAKGWWPIGIAVVISSFGGLILTSAKSRFLRLAVFQPVINGVGGNLVAVQASRISTSLHKICKLGELPNNSRLFVGPREAFFVTRRYRDDINVKTARLLLLMAIPAHLLYFYVIHYIEGYSSNDTTWLFVSLYMGFAMLQVAILLYSAHNLINFLWKRRIDPDNYATPLLTAAGDFLGCAFLLIVFLIANQFDDPFAKAELVSESDVL